MNRKQTLSRLMRRLVTRRNALLKTLEEELGRFGTEALASAVGDKVDAAVDTASDEICSQIVELESKELGEIEHALGRGASGNYGRCECCGCKIAAVRLTALPYASHCIRCQRESERGGSSRMPETDSRRWKRVYENPLAGNPSGGRINWDDLERDLGEAQDLPEDSLTIMGAGSTI
jgi:DnaK suppressor protein